MALIPKKLLDVPWRRPLSFVLFITILVILLVIFFVNDTRYKSEK